MLTPVLLDGFTHRLYAVAALHPFSVTSWGRTPLHNKYVGGVKNSRHLDWLAVDVVPDSQKDLKVLFSDLSLLGLVVINEGDHLHVQAPNPPSGLLKPFVAPVLPPPPPEGRGEGVGIPPQRPGGPPIQSERT